MKTETLRDLVIARPDLDITPFVSEEASCPDYNWTVASVYKCSIDKLATNPHNDERILVYSNDRDNFIDEYLYRDEDETISDDEAEQLAESAYENLPWKETILLYIEAY
jgi:hypothetical protein